MTSKELIQLIAAHEPELLDKFASVLRDAEQEDAETFGEVLHGIEVVASRISGHEKTAKLGDGDFKKNITEGAGKAIGSTAVGVAAGLAAAGGSDLYHYAKSKLTKRRNWKQLMEHNPHWQHGRWDADTEMSAEHKAKIHKAFDTVHRLAPSVASDPITSTVYVRQLSTNPEAHETLKRLADTHKSLSEAREKTRLRLK